MSAMGQKRTSPSLFDHLVSAGKQQRRDGEIESLRRLEIDYQFKLGRRLHSELGSLGAREDAADIIWCLVKLFGEISTVRNQTARIKAMVVDRWEAVAGRQRNNCFPICYVECAGHHDETASRIARLCGDNALDFIRRVNRSNLHLDVKGRRGGPNGRHVVLQQYTCFRVEKKRHAQCARSNLVQ